jgi:signal transduction histidine kinase
MNILINDVLEEFDDEIKEKNAKVIVDKIPLLHVHPGLITVLFRNLIGNALKFTRENVCPVINIHAEVSPYQNGQSDEFICQIFIRDNGIGFDQQFAEKVFGMFTRLHPETQVKGTGLGLALCRKIAEHHKGSIAARSLVNEGTTFILSLPRQSITKKSKRSLLESVK